LKKGGVMPEKGENHTSLKKGRQENSSLLGKEGDGVKKYTGKNDHPHT